MSFPEHIFKAYDIRGLVAGELSPDLAYRLGHAFIQFLRSHQLLNSRQAVVVGRDMRATSAGLAEAVSQGVQEEGVSVVDVGLVSTPLFNFACAHYPEHAGGIMVTASHNPAEYNGFKMTLGNGLPIGGASGMGEIKELVRNWSSSTVISTEAQRSGEFPVQLAANRQRSLAVARDDKLGVVGMTTKKNVLPDYLKKIFSLVPPSSLRPLKIVIDAGNGMAKATFPKIIEQLPLTVEYLYLEPDGRFPNHEANPLKVETLRDLQRQVVASGADFGFALDGDADRIGLVDEQGEVVDASLVGALVGLEVLENHPGGRMLYDVRSSMIVPEIWQAAGASVEMCKVGHANIKKALKENKGLFASELSLHLYYHDMYDVESTDLSLLYILQFLSREQKPLSELVLPLKKYFHSGEINFHIENKVEVMKKIEEEYSAQGGSALGGKKAKEISRLDGLWMKFAWGWFSVRLSNTEPVLRLNLEATTKKLMEEKVKEMSALIKS